MSRHWRTSSAAVLVVVEHEHDGPVRVDEPTEPAGERRAQRVGDRAGDVAVGERGDRADVDDCPAGGEVGLDVVDTERFERGAAES